MNGTSLSFFDEWFKGFDMMDVDGVERERPKNRSECKDGARPCPYVGCKYHLYLDVKPHTGTIKFNHKEKEPWELEHSCALDVADKGALTLHEVGVLIGLTRERIRQCEEEAIGKMIETTEARCLHEFWGEDKVQGYRSFRDKTGIT